MRPLRPLSLTHKPPSHPPTLTPVHIPANLTTVEEDDRILCDKQAREIS